MEEENVLISFGKEQLNKEEEPSHLLTSIKPMVNNRTCIRPESHHPIWSILYGSFYMVHIIWYMWPYYMVTVIDFNLVKPMI